MSVPIHRLTKKELVWLATHRCKHGHTFLDHYACYKPQAEEKLGFLDIEVSNLDADFGIILSYCIKKARKREILYGVITEEDLRQGRGKGDEDRRVVEKLVEDLGKFDRIVGYYSSRFDIPYIRARALMVGVDFPTYGTLAHTDLYFLIRSKFKLSSRRLENACRTLLGKTLKTRIESAHWRAAACGDEESLKYVLDHNKKDVIDLERLYWKVERFGRITNTSI